MGKILFLHPDLGIGGAERLVVDAALALKQKGHSVQFVTNHHDPNHCFEETRDGSLNITVVGDWIPRHLAGKFYAFWAYLRLLYAALYMLVFIVPYEKPDIIFCDQISIAIPILRLFSFKRFSVIFYCHFPDLLLSKPGGLLKTYYRKPLNWLEEYTTSKADVILVNSKFTSRVFKSTFKTISTSPDILYPSINTKNIDNTHIPEEVYGIESNVKFILSINRFERKKDISLVLNSFAKFRALSNDDNLKLIIIGGYDERVIENVEYYEELQTLAKSLDVSSEVTFLKSPSDAIKYYLLKHCVSLIYSPQNEHFGIVPLEAMYMGKPVIACNSGGPTETVMDSVTGFLCDPDPDKFAEAIVNSIERSDELGRKGEELFKTRFSFSAFSDQLNHIISNQMKRKHVAHKSK